MKKKTGGIPSIEWGTEGLPFTPPFIRTPGSVDARRDKKAREWGINFLVNSLKASYPKKGRDIERFAKLLKEQGPCDLCHRNPAWTYCVPCNLVSCERCGKTHFSKEHKAL